VAAGAHGIFIEAHEDPDRALCDGPNSLALKDVPLLLEMLAGIYRQVRRAGGEEVK
jgi:2-dehydro-3-deoxyphosphooctonate aldolase (KDO 8-P synthase)